MSRYDDYLGSEAWSARRARFWASHERACVACGATEVVQLHHLVYVPEVFGSEPDGDLVPLCVEHHEALHLFHASRAAEETLRQSTAAYLARFGVTIDAGEARDEPRHHDRWLEDVAVDCPVCAAPAGEACVKVQRGRRVAIRQVHGRRKAAAKRAA